MDIFKVQQGASSGLIDELLDHGVTYCSVTILDTDGKAFFSKSSSDEWQKKYMESDLYKRCHLMREASYQIQNQTNSFIFVWDKYFPTNEESKYLSQLRKERNIDHGVAFCSKLENGTKSIVTVTGKHHDINFSNLVLKNKKPIYSAIMRSLVSL